MRPQAPHALVAVHGGAHTHVSPMLALTASGCNSPSTVSHTTTLQTGLQKSPKRPKVPSTYRAEPSQLQNRHFPPLSDGSFLAARVLKETTATQNASTDSGVPQLVGRKCRVRRAASIRPPYLGQRAQPVQLAGTHAEVSGSPM